MNFMIVRTIGFISKLSEDAQIAIMKYALARINPKTNWVIFDPNCEQDRLEDEGRTLRVGMKHLNLKKKVYAILDDFGEPSEWDKMYEPEITESLRKAPNCRYTITFLLGEEY